MGDFDKAKRLASKLCRDSKYMYRSHVTGVIATLVFNYGMSLSQEMIDGVKEALIDHFFYGLDPEFDDEEMYFWFENLSPQSFEIKGKDLLFKGN
jgi:hypothetical protein